MSNALCTTCDAEWDASRSPLCVQCECRRLLTAPNLISGKHDPRRPPLADFDYRSRLSHDFVENAKQFIEYAAGNGGWFYSTVHETWNLFTHEPLGRSPGSGIHAGSALPDHALDGLMVADVLADPHAFAVDEVFFRKKVRVGEFVALERCRLRDCGNLSVPGDNACVLHADPPLARPVG